MGGGPTTRSRREPDPSVVLLPGPWQHRVLSANGVRLHVAECGQGPLVLLLHGFPQFWWSFRHQLTALAGAGYRAVAADLRGYGASDKPPRGYDAVTLAADVAGLVRALGEEQAVLVGHDWGAVLAWSAAALHPAAVRRVAVLAMPHPLLMRRWLLTRPGSNRHLWFFQLPWSPERRLVDDDAAYVQELLRRWGGPGYPDPDTARHYRDAMLIPGVPHSALEYFRWAVRSLPRPDGQRFARALSGRILAPTLQVHGALDSCTPLAAAHGAQRYVAGTYRFEVLADAGHFPHEERPAAVNDLLLGWLAG